MAYRSIHSSVSESESLAALTAGAERLFWRALAMSDNYGRLPAEPRKLRARCMPLVRCSEAQVAGWVEELERVGRARTYLVDGNAFLELLDFDRWQPRDFLRKRGKPEFPPPTENGSTMRDSGGSAALRAATDALRADVDALRAPQNVVEEPLGPRRRLTPRSSSSSKLDHPRADAPEGLIDAALIDAFDTLGPSKTQRARWLAAADVDPERVAACVAAAAEADRPAAYLDELVKRGEWPGKTKPGKEASAGDGLSRYDRA